MRSLLPATIVLTLCLAAPALAADKVFRVSASGSYKVSNESPSPPSTDRDCAGMQFTRYGEASYRIKSRKGSDTVTLGSGQFNDVAAAAVKVIGSGTVTETITNSPPGCPIPNRETPQNCERTKATSIKVTLRGTRIGGLTDPPKNILGSRCPPEIVGFQANTIPNKTINYAKLKGLAVGKSLKVNFNQSDTGPFGGFGTQTWKLVLKLRLTRVK